MANSAINKVINSDFGVTVNEVRAQIEETGIKAFFSISSVTLAQGEFITCTNLSTGFITSYSWCLNGALISTETNIDVQILNLGTNTIKLTVYGGGYTSSYSLSLEATEGFATNFSATPLKGESPLDTQFTSVIAGGTAPYTYMWTKVLDSVSTVFSTEANPLETLTDLGCYSITLKVTDAYGIEVEHIEQNMIEVVDMTADFVGSPLSGALPLQVAFTNNSVGIIDEYLWEISNDLVNWVSVGINRDLDYLFNFTGFYSVRLTISNGVFTESETKEDYIKAGGAVRVEQHNFSITNANQAEDFSVTLSNPFLNENLVVEIKSSTGKLVEADGIDITATSIVINFIEYLPEGTFIITIIGEDLS